MYKEKVLFQKWAELYLFYLFKNQIQLFSKAVQQTYGLEWNQKKCT
ncbi:hypothetical protein bthur0001_23280 [Bacillus thuringiensis serovar tochigiensis BGSC 4Y1]|nr:hypothetical protein bthur0001_23280 [Bacillus thuringiensis serovar tochigiensis BGSC 4Y1]